MSHLSQILVVLIAGIANNMDIICTILVFKVDTMFPNSCCVGGIVTTTPKTDEFCTVDNTGRP